MAIEKAFAINAPPADIWEKLTGELQVGDDQQYRIQRAIPNELLELWVEFGGEVQAALTYRLIPRDDYTEVVATLSPMGFRSLLSRIVTLGRSDTNYEMMLVQGLSNLKQAVEGNAAEPDVPS